MLVIQVKSTPGTLVAMAPILIGSPVAGSPVPMPHSPDAWMLLAPPPAGSVSPGAVVPAPVSLGAVVAAPVSLGAVVAAAVSLGAVAAAGPPPAVVPVAPSSSSSSPHAASTRTAAAASPSSERFMCPSP